MPQSSLTAWLNQPKAVQRPPHQANDPVLSHIAQQQAPTPPHDEPATWAPVPKASDPPLLSFDKLRPLPSNVELRSCTKEDIPHLKRLTSLLLPIPYSEKFYKEILEDEITANLTLLAVWHDAPIRCDAERGRLVGAIRCRLLNQNDASVGASTCPRMLYLSTLVLLSPFRNHGIATHLLQRLTRRAIDDYGVSSVGAHVWEANMEGLEWYKKRGFKESRREPGYYRRLDPQGAVIMQRDVRVLDHLNR